MVTKPTSQHHRYAAIIFVILLISYIVQRHPDHTLANDNTVLFWSHHEVNNMHSN